MLVAMYNASKMLYRVITTSNANLTKWSSTINPLAIADELYECVFTILWRLARKGLGLFLKFA